MLIEKADTDTDGALDLEWDLQRHLADGFTACRGLRIKAGTTFHVDIFWCDENGVLIDVIWHDHSQTFGLLSLLKLRPWPQPSLENQRAVAHA